MLGNGVVMRGSRDADRHRVIQHDPGNKKSPTFPQAEHWLPTFLGLEHIAASH